MVRVNDTRYFHDFQTDYVLREYTNKECGIREVRLPYTMFGDPNLLSPHMPLRTAYYHKIKWPEIEISEAKTENTADVLQTGDSMSMNDVNSEGDAL